MTSSRGAPPPESGIRCFMSEPRRGADALLGGGLACRELLARASVAGIQDMGAAGLTCSTCETASRGNSGIEIDLSKVPQREPGMTPYETMLSESQERMLIIVREGHEATVTKIFEKWDLPCALIGRVTDDGFMR